MRTLHKIAIVTLLLLWGGTVHAAVVQICGFETGDATEAVVTSGTFDAGYTVVKRTGTYALRSNPTTTAVGYMDFRQGGGPDLGASAYARFYFRYATKAASGDEPIASFTNTGNVLKFELRLNSSGNLVAYDGGAAAVTDGTGAAATLNAGTWYRIEININEVGAGDTDTFTVKVDGVDDITGTDDLAASNVRSIRLGKTTNRNGNSVDYFYDDLSIDNTTFPGEGQVSIMRPDGDGNVTTWTLCGGCAGADWENVDEVPPDGDTTYLVSTLVNTETSNVTLQSAASAGITGTIAAVKGVVVVKNDGAGNGTFLIRLRSGGTNLDVGGIGATATYAGATGHLRTTDPSDSLAWTLADLNGLEVGAREGETTDRTRVTAMYVMVDYVPGAAETCDATILLLGIGC